MQPTEGTTTSAELQAAFQEVGMQSLSFVSAVAGSPPMCSEQDPTAAVVVAADVLIGQALAGLTHAAREDAMRQLLTGVSSQPDAKRRAPAYAPPSPMRE